MTIRTQEAMQAQIDSLLASNTSGSISESDCRSVFQDLVDTAESRWTVLDGDAVDTLITAFADNTSGDRTPAEVRAILKGISDVVFTLSIAPKQPNVTAWWEFEDDFSGYAKILDEVASYELTQVNQCTSSAAVDGNGVNIVDAGGDFLRTESQTDYTALLNVLCFEDTAWSHSIWYKTPASIVSNGMVSGTWTPSVVSGSSEKQWCVKVNSGGTGFEARINQSGGIHPDYENSVTVSTGDISLAINTWYHLVITHDPVADEMTLTVNAGTRNATAIIGGCTANGGTDKRMQLGAGVGSGAWRNDGMIDMCGFFNVALDAVQVSALYNDGSGLNYTALPAA